MKRPTLKQLKPKLGFIRNKYRPILSNIKVSKTHMICTDLETTIEFNDNFDLTPGLQGINTLGLLESSSEHLDDFPHLTIDENFQKRAIVNWQELMLVNKHASKDETRLQLNGVCFDNDYMVATTGHHLKCVKIASGTIEDSFIVPRTSLVILEKLLKLYKCKDETTEILFNEKFATVKTEYFTWQARIIQREFPRWAYAIPTSFKRGFKVTNWQGVKEVKPLLNKHMPTCRIVGEGSYVFFKIPDRGYSLPIGVKTGDDFEIGFNAEYFDLASEGKGEFIIKWNDNLNPIEVNGVIVMPLKI